MSENNTIQGSTRFQWVDGSIAPEVAGVYKVVLLLGNNQEVTTSANFDGRRWKFKEDWMGNFFSRYLISEQPPLPSAMNVVPQGNYRLAEGVRLNEQQSTPMEAPEMTIPEVNNGMINVLRTIHRTSSSLPNLDLLQVIWPNRNHSDYSVQQDSLQELRGIITSAEAAGLLAVVDNIATISEAGITLLNNVQLEDEANESGVPVNEQTAGTMETDTNTQPNF